MTMTCTTASSLLGCKVLRRPSGTHGCLAVTRRRLRALDKLIRRVLSVDVRQQGSVLLGVIRIPIGRIVRPLVSRRRLGIGSKREASGGIDVSLSMRSRGLIIRTSQVRFSGVIDGLVSGTVGCSRSDIGVRVGTYRGTRSRILISMSSGKVNVTRSGLPCVFSGFCQIASNGGCAIGNCNLKLFCIGDLVRGVNNSISMRDRPKGKDYFALRFLGNGGMGKWGDGGRTVGGVGMLLMRSRASLTVVLNSALRTRNFRVHATRSNRRKLHVFSRRGPSILMTSIVVPGVSNFRVIHHVHGASSHAPILFLATHSTIGSIMRKFRLNNGSCLGGPFTVRRLVIHVGSLYRQTSMKGVSSRRRGKKGISPSGPSTTSR